MTMHSQIVESVTEVLHTRETQGSMTKEACYQQCWWMPLGWLSTEEACWNPQGPQGQQVDGLFNFDDLNQDKQLAGASIQ